MRVGAHARLLLFVAALGGCASAGARTGGGRPRPVSERAALAMFIDSLADQPKFRSAHWGILVVDPATHDTLYSRNAGKLFMPASNQKLVTGSVALHQLGPDYRFRTTFAATGAVAQGTLQGDLVVDGRGDPSISDHMVKDAMLPMRAIADSLRARGITRIAGRLRPGGDAFPDATLGFGWSWDDLDFDYSAGVDELYFNEGFSDVHLRAGASPGEPVTATVGPSRSYPAVRVTAVTGPARQQGVRAVRPTVLQDSAQAGVVVVGGAVPAGETTTVSITHRDPTAAYLAALREALGDAGIALGDTTVAPIAGAARAVPRADTLFTMLSPPLREVIAALEKPSQNQIAEIFLKTIGLERTGVGSADSGARVVRDQLVAWGARPDGFIVRDGSGLSRHNVIAPETIIRVLDAIRSDTAFAVFYAALPIAGVDGTIANRMRGTRAAGNVHAKTGSIDLARSLSGYVTTAGGRLLLFSVLCNNYTTTSAEVTGTADRILARIAELQLGGGVAASGSR
jgi:serine-type D-Ala-D-Ala carboxypeptidase/endopeptidase (penicillin-binding protein 4)